MVNQNEFRVHVSLSTDLITMNLAVDELEETIVELERPVKESKKQPKVALAEVLNTNGWRTSKQVNKSNKMVFAPLARHQSRD